MADLSPRLIPGTGPAPARLLFCGESPGEQEDREGIPFVPGAPAGRELSRLCRSILRIDRTQCFITNLLPYHPPGNRDPSPSEILEHEHFLLTDLDRVRPEVVVPLGRHAARWLLDWPKASMAMCNARLYPNIQKAGQSFSVFPIAHPAGGLRKPSLRLACHYGFTQLARYLQTGEADLRHLDDCWPNPRYRHASTRLEVLQYLADRPSVHRIAIDTEGSVEDPYCVTLCSEEGTGILSLASDPEALAAIAEHAASEDVTTFLHFSLHDIPVLRAMGIYPRNIEDTGIDAFLTCINPQGLKPLGYRECGVQNREYSDLVGPYNESIALEYLQQVTDRMAPCLDCGGGGRVIGKNALKKGYLDNESFWLDPISRCRGMTRQCKPCAGTGKVSGWPAREGRTPDSLASSKLKAHVEGKGIDLHTSWKGCVARESAEGLLGPMREADLNDPPFEEVLDYAVKDADVTLRVASQLVPQIPSGEVRSIDQSVVPMVERMQANGIYVKPGYFAKLGEELGKELEGLSSQASAECGHLVLGSLNLSSQDEMAWYLFEHHGIRPLRLTPVKRRGAVDQQSITTLLDRLAKADAPLKLLSALRLCESYSQLETLKTTYCDKLEQWIGLNGRLHAEFGLTRVPSGRLNVKNPNLLAIPVRTEWGRRIRHGFCAQRDEWLLGTWDLCLTGDTEVIAVDGPRRLDQIVKNGIGTGVLSVKEDSLSLEFKQVLAGTCTGVHNVYEIVFQNGSKVKCTANHKWLERASWRENKLTWIEAKDIVPGTRLSHVHEQAYSHKRGNHVVKSVRLIGKEKTYNIHVESNHNFVLLNGLVSKNCNIEVRVLADHSMDKVLLEVMRSGGDLHSRTAVSLFGSDAGDYRGNAKTINFAMFYGVSPKGLMAQLNEKGMGITEKDAAHMIDEWFALYSGVKRYMDRQVELARLRGYAVDMFGRIRYLPAIYSDDPRARSEAERQAMNHDIQSSAQGIIKRAMANIWNRVLTSFWAAGDYVEPLLQIHDELVFEFHASVTCALDALVRHEMASAVQLRVPVSADGCWGKSWGDLK